MIRHDNTYIPDEESIHIQQEWQDIFIIGPGEFHYCRSNIVIVRSHHIYGTGHVRSDHGGAVDIATTRSDPLDESRDVSGTSVSIVASSERDDRDLHGATLASDAIATIVLVATGVGARQVTGVQ